MPKKDEKNKGAVKPFAYFCLRPCASVGCVLPLCVCVSGYMGACKQPLFLVLLLFHISLGAVFLLFARM